MGDVWMVLNVGFALFVVALTVRLLRRGTTTSKATLYVFAFLWGAAPFNLIMTASDNLLVATVSGALGILAGYVLLPQYVRVVPVEA